MAKVFRFRLEKILNLRTQKVNELKEELNRVLAVRYKKEKEISDTNDYLNNLKGPSKCKIKAENLLAFGSHINKINDDLKFLSEELADIKEIENAGRTKLIEAMKDEKILLKLKEKKHLSHNEELRLLEVKELDEIAQSRHSKVDSSLRIDVS